VNVFVPEFQKPTGIIPFSRRGFLNIFQLSENSVCRRDAAANRTSWERVSPDTAFIEAHEANLIARSADPNHAKACFSAAMVHFDNRSALNDRRSMFQASTTAADIVSENRLLETMTGVVNSG
jgi:hypothetical protein